jgi:hypothetical protein
MAKHILDLHRTILFPRPCHPGHVAAGALALALLPMFWPSAAAAHTCDDPFRTDLLTARGIDVGQVTVCNDAEFLTITYETTWPWCVLRTNLHVARDLAGIPRIRLLGTPNFLRFDFIEEVDCEVPAPVEIPLAEIDGGVVPGETVTIAARAVVEGEGPDGTHPRCLLGDKCVAWGEGPRFRPRLPAMYFTYEVQESFDCPATGGVEVGGACWFRADQGDSCAEACSGVGLGYDEATATYAGSGGTLDQCVMVAEALGFADDGPGEGGLRPATGMHRHRRGRHRPLHRRTHHRGSKLRPVGHLSAVRLQVTHIQLRRCGRRGAIAQA